MQLKNNEVHVWAYSIDHTKIDYRSYLSLLNADELKKAYGHFSNELAQKFVITRALLKKILAKYIKVFPWEINFKASCYGKPQISIFLNKNIYFNLSHSNNLAVCIVSNFDNIGIDIEYIEPMNNGLKLAKNFFSQNEYSNLLANPESVEKNFYRIWTKKESILKSIGCGLVIPLNSFSVPISTRNGNIFTVGFYNIKEKKWYLKDFRIGNYVGTIAINKGILWSIKWMKLVQKI